MEELGHSLIVKLKYLLLTPATHTLTITITAMQSHHLIHTHHHSCLHPTCAASSLSLPNLATMLKATRQKLTMCKAADVGFLEGVIENFMVARGSRDLRGLLEVGAVVFHMFF